jgi:hypothetical protein
MDFMVERKDLETALSHLLRGKNEQSAGLLDMNVEREVLTLVVTGSSEEVPIETAEIGSISIPMGITVKVKKMLKTYPDRIRVRAQEGRLRIESTAINSAEIRVRKVVEPIIDIPDDARPLDVLSLPYIFTGVEIADSGLEAKLERERRALVQQLASASSALSDYGVTPEELRSLADQHVRNHAPGLKKVLFSS